MLEAMNEYVCAQICTAHEWNHCAISIPLRVCSSRAHAWFVMDVHVDEFVCVCVCLCVCVSMYLGDALDFAGWCAGYTPRLLWFRVFCCSVRERMLCCLVLVWVCACLCVRACVCVCVCVLVLFCGRKADECPMLKCSVLCVLGAFCSSPFIPLRVCSSMKASCVFFSAVLFRIINIFCGLTFVCRPLWLLLQLMTSPRSCLGCFQKELTNL